MAKRVTNQALLDLAAAIGRVGARHGIAADRRVAFVSDAMFEVSVFVDRVVGSSTHEAILGLVEANAEALALDPPPADHLVAEVEVTFRKRRKAELNVLASHLAREASLRLVLEVALGVRSVEEIRARVDVEERFTTLAASRGPVLAVRVRRADVESPRWRSIPLRGSPLGDFDETVRGVLRCILAAVREAPVR